MSSENGEHSLRPIIEQAMDLVDKTYRDNRTPRGYESEKILEAVALDPEAFRAMVTALVKQTVEDNPMFVAMLYVDPDNPEVSEKICEGFKDVVDNLSVYCAVLGFHVGAMAMNYRQNAEANVPKRPIQRPRGQRGRTR